MTPADLDIVIKANVNSATQGMASLQNSLAQTAVAATKLDSAFDNTSKKINKNSITTVQSIQNISNVFRDLPFAINNPAIATTSIDHVISSLTTLSQQSGGVKAALSALGASLSGPSGILLAFSAVSSILTLFGDKLFGTSNAATEGKKSVDEYAAAVHKAVQDIVTESVKIDQLIEVLKRETISREQRKEAINQLKQISPEYFKQLDDEKTNIENLTIAYAAYIQNLIAAVKSKAAENQLESLNQKLVSTAQKIDEVNQRFANTQTFGGIANQKEIQGILDKSLKTYQDIQRLSQLTGQSESALKQNLTQRNSLLVDQTRILDQIDQLGGNISTTDLLKGLNINTTVKTKIDEVAKVLEKLAADQKALSESKVVLDLDKPFEDLKLIDAAITRLRELNASEPIIIKLQTEIDNEALAAVGGQLQKQFGDLKNLKLPDIQFPAIKAPLQFVVPNEETQFTLLQEQVRSLSEKLHITLPVNFDALNKEELKAILDAIPSDVKIKLGITGDQTGFKEFIKNLADSQRAIDDLNKSIANTTLDTITNAFADFGKAIGTQGNPFAALFKVFSQGLELLGKSLIEYGVEVGIIQKIFANPLNPISPALAIGAGIALEALASLLQSKVSHFAEGGIVTAPILGLIGERGKEVVIPLDRIHEVLNLDNGNSVFIAENRISGQDIVTAFKRADKHNRRTY